METDYFEIKRRGVAGILDYLAKERDQDGRARGGRGKCRKDSNSEMRRIRNTRDMKYEFLVFLRNDRCKS
jgi:hypothetical protein